MFNGYSMFDVDFFSFRYVIINMRKNLHCEEGWIRELQVPSLPETADVTLLCSDNKKFYAHSVSLIVIVF